MGLFKRSRAAARLENIIDVHSHILPGIDDGSKSMEQSLEMLEIAVQEGIRTIIATPHNMPGKGKASPGQVEKLVRDLQTAADAQKLPITLLPGCELFYREEALELLEQEEILSLNDSACVLVEFDVMAQKPYITNAMRNVLSLGYTPVIAHVERYEALMEKGFTTLRELRAMGCLIQVNADSVTGGCTAALQKSARKLLQEQLVEFIGTDAHSSRSRAPRMQECIRFLGKWCPEDYIRALMCKNAQLYFDI